MAIALQLISRTKCALFVMQHTEGVTGSPCWLLQSPDRLCWRLDWKHPRKALALRGANISVRAKALEMIMLIY